MIQMLTPFRADQYVYQGGAALGAGIGGGIEKLGDALGKAIEAKKQRNARAKAAGAFYKNSPDLQRHLGISPEDFESLSADDKTDAVETGVSTLKLHTELARAQQEKEAHVARLAEDIAKQKERTSAGLMPQTILEGLESQARPGQYPPTAEGFDEAVNAQSGLSPVGMALLRASARDRVPLPASIQDELIGKKSGSLTLQEALAAARNPPPGFSKGNLQINPNGTPGLTFQPVETRPTSIDPIPLTGGGNSGKGWADNNKMVDLPTDRSKSLTEAQANALSYSERMKYNNAIIGQLETAGFNPAGLGAAIQDWAPNFMTVEAYQRYNAAQRNWVSAVLRKESGAAISKSEESGAIKQYFPALGDSPGTVAQKAALRLLAEENMHKAIGDIQRDGKADVGAPAGEPQFDSEEQARAAGHNTGDIIRVYDPETRTYRRGRLK